MEQGNRKLKVDSKENCYVLPDGFEPLKNKAKTAELQPGIHVLRINKGTFSFNDGSLKDCYQPQPYVLLWIEGGLFKNKACKSKDKASDMPVSFSWACLNGYNDTCTLEVIAVQGATTTLHALFIDCARKINNEWEIDNVGQIELSILSESDETAEDSLLSEAAEFASAPQPVCCAAPVPDETEKKVAGWYEVNEKEDGQFYFVLKAGNGEVILSGVPRAQWESAEQDIAAVRANCAVEERYEKQLSEDGKPCFILKDADNQIIGSSQDYSSEAACSKGMASVKRNGSSKVTKEIAEA